MGKKIILLVCLSFFSVNILSAPLEIVNSDTGVVSSVRKILELNLYTKLQFSRYDDVISFVESDSNGGVGIEVQYSPSFPVLTFNPGVFLYEKTKFEFTIQATAENVFQGSLLIDFLSGERVELPIEYVVTNIPRTVEVQLKGLPQPIDEIVQLHWVLDSTDLLGMESVNIIVSDLACFSDSAKVVFQPRVVTYPYYESESSISSTSIISSSESPVIGLIKFDGKAILDGDYISKRATISSEVSDYDDGVSQWSVSLFDFNTQSLISESATQNLSPTEDVVSLQYVFNDEFDDGNYFIKIIAADESGNITQKESPSFFVSDTNQFNDVVFGPSPFNPNSTIAEFNYDLNQDSAVEISIFSIDGEQVWHKKCEEGDLYGGSAGFNRIEWDGINKYGEVVGNGPYISYLVATFDGEKIIKKVKIMVLK
jgi:hypothetical protein